MGFLLGQLKMLGMVALIIACATVGTVGIIKLLKHIMPGKELPKDPISKKFEG